VIVETTFATVILDVDCTVSGIEGIDWLAGRQANSVARAVAELTEQAMRGAIPLERVYGARLDLVQPTRADVDALARVYLSAIAPGCPAAVRQMREAGVRVLLVSGGLRPAILPLAEHLGVEPADLHAVDISFDAAGDYAGYDAASALTTASGKRILVERLGLSRPVLAVGDGITDLAMRPAVDQFAAYTGFVRRDAIVRQADVVVDSFPALLQLVLARPGGEGLT
jgi:phosphoserine phosphatase